MRPGFPINKFEISQTTQHHLSKGQSCFFHLLSIAPSGRSPLLQHVWSSADQWGLSLGLVKSGNFPVPPLNYPRQPAKE